MKHCMVCGEELINKIVSMENMPKMAQNMPKKEELDVDEGINLDLYQCSKCGMIQFDCDPVYYYKDVIRACGISNKMRQMRLDQYKDFIETFNLENKKICEIGCGDGAFLEILSTFDVKSYGIENNPELCAICNKKGLSVKQEFADDRYHDADAPFDAFISINFLEHQPNPNEMLRGIYNNLSDDGVGLITVPSFEYFVSNSSYYEFIRDHIANYTHDSLMYLLIQNGFSIVKEYRFNYDTLCVYVKKRSCVDGSIFIQERESIREQIDQLLEVEKGKIAVWGASHQAFTILSTTSLGEHVSLIIDSAKFKTGLYSPVSHIRICLPEVLQQEDIDTVVIIAPAYSDEIFEIICKNYASIKHIYSIFGKEICRLK